MVQSLEEFGGGAKTIAAAAIPSVAEGFFRYLVDSEAAGLRHRRWRLCIWWLGDGCDGRSGCCCFDA